MVVFNFVNRVVNRMLYRLKTDFRLSIITMLGMSAILGITPFAVLRFVQGNALAGIVDLIILICVTAGMSYSWLTGDTRRGGMFMAVMICSGAVVVGMVAGEPGLFWLYPCLVTTFFLTNPRLAVVLNVASVLALLFQSGIYSSEVQKWTFVATAMVVSSCAFVFAHRNAEQRRRLEQMATVDPLTGVKNRRSMDEELENATVDAERTGASYSLVVLDLDHFKKINDTYGHSVGDEVLVDLVAVLEQHTRRADRLFRFGGEEFVLLLPGVDEIGQKRVLAHLQQTVRKYVRHPGGRVTASFGVAMLQHGESVESWLERADDALYRAKSEGRDRVVFADEPETSAVH